MTVLTPHQAFAFAAEHHRAGRLAEADALYRRLLALEPNNADLLHVLGIIAYQSGALPSAVDWFRRAISLNPSATSYHNNLGSVLQDQGLFNEATEAYRRAIACGGKIAPACTNLGNALKAQGKFEEALEAYQLSLQHDPHLPEAHANLAVALQSEGELDEAIALYERAIHLPGHLAGIYDNYLATLHYWSRTTLRGLSEAHRAYDARYAQPFRADWQPLQNSRDPKRPLRLGFVSPHFRLHPVGHFFVRLLENLPQGDFHTVCYADSNSPDLMTSRLRACAAEWHETQNVSDHLLAQRIREDRIDILFDLAGHTPGNRLLVFARKPAPLQITWLDYVGTTGLSAIDYILADPRQIPPEAESFYGEKVLRLPDDYICFDPPANAPAVGPLPAAAKGFVTFASFNLLPKTTAQIVAIWGRILQQVPDSRLILKNLGFDRPAPRARLRQQFSEHSIDPGRIVFQGRSPHAELLATYNEVDIALDTFPYNGGLTTCEALWMGVPVVTCPGETFASRHGLAHLTAAGIPETIATDFDDYVRIAVALARDRPRLSTLREGLRARVGVSALCDGHRFAQNFAALLHEVWRHWCQGV